MAGRKGQQQAADPAARTLKAAEECRAATREAHEAIQALAEMKAEVAALIAEARQFTLAHVTEAVPREVKRQLDALLPVTQQAMTDAVAKVSKEFERIEALFLGKGNHGKPSLEELIGFLGGKEKDGKPSLEELITPKDDPRCPYCGYAGWQKPVGDDKDVRPQPAGKSVSLCSRCHKPSIFVTGPLPGDLMLRKPTPVEEAALAKNREAKHARRIVKQMSSPPGRP